MNKIGAFIILALLAVASVNAVNYVRWNNLLDECVYYYNDLGQRAHCFVPEKNCPEQDAYTNYFRDADVKSCYYVPNDPPKLTVHDINISEGDRVNLNVTCNDTGKVTIKYSGKMKIATWQTGYTDAGIHKVKVECHDTQGLSDTKIVTITVYDKNRPPKIVMVRS
jgi:hypothetical protein